MCERYNHSTITELKSIRLITFFSNLFIEEGKREETFYFSLRDISFYTRVSSSRHKVKDDIELFDTYRDDIKDPCKKKRCHRATRRLFGMLEKCATLVHANSYGHIVNFRTGWYLSILINTACTLFFWSSIHVGQKNLLKMCVAHIK